ncbi:MAG: sugar transferase [Clostridia bacterium]|nr:sugar transferase [Clostridia bacterium]
MTVALFIAMWVIGRMFVFGTSNAAKKYDILVAVGFSVFYALMCRTYHAFRLGYMRIRSIVTAQFLAQGFSVAIIYVILCIGWVRFLNPLPFLALFPVYAVGDILWGYFGNLIFFRTTASKSTLLIYRNERDKMRFHSMKGKPVERLYTLSAEVMYNGDFDGIKDVLDGFDAVFVAGVNSQCRNSILKYCQENGKPGFFIPHVGDVIMRGSEHIISFDAPVMLVRRKTLNPEYAFVKRAFDVFASLVGIIILSPLMTVTALAVKLCDGGPVLYRQTRLTKDGKPFEILKFRSMRTDAEKDGVARLSTGEKDDRITPVGRVMRKVRLDELPQLFNILKGDMSVVGPRPERPEIAEQYCAEMPDFGLRLQVKAGLTGYAQVYGKYNTDPYEKLEFDLMYINSMGIMTDLQLIFKTISILFSPDSTEGVAAGQVTALEFDPDPASEREKAGTDGEQGGAA